MNAIARQPIRHGMFIMPFHPPSKPFAQSFDEDLELIVRAEELDWDDKPSWLHSLELFAKELMPRLNKALA